MTITPFRDNKGQPAATVKCDGCGATIEIKVQHERTRGGPDQVHLGNASRKLHAMGWVFTTKRQTCPACQTKAWQADTRKRDMEEPVSTTPTIPAPAEATREQKREIMLMLQEVYDTEKQRYKGEETDKTVAHALGIERWGWVSKIREELFGPAGNEAGDKLLAEVKEKIALVDEVVRIMREQEALTANRLSQILVLRDELAALLKRVKVAG